MIKTHLKYSIFILKFIAFKTTSKLFVSKEPAWSDAKVNDKVKIEIESSVKSEEKFQVFCHFLPTKNFD